MLRFSHRWFKKAQVEKIPILIPQEHFEELLDDVAELIYEYAIHNYENIQRKLKETSNEQCNSK